jgi:hypothetical protein
VLPDHQTVDAADVRPARQHHSHLKFTLQDLDDLRDAWLPPFKNRKGWEKVHQFPSAEAQLLSAFLGY